MLTMEFDNSISKKHIFVHILLIVMLAMGSISNLTQIATIVVLLICFSIIFEPVEQNFYLIIMLAPFENLMAINGRKVFSIVFILFLLKCLVRDKRISGNNVGCLFAAMYLAAIEVVNAYTVPYANVSPFALLNTIAYVLYFYSVISGLKTQRISVKEMLYSFNISILIVIIVSFNSYGSINSFIQQAKQAEYVLRLGHKTVDTLGGAMGIPLYAAVAVSLNIIYVTQTKGENGFTKLLFLAITALAVVFGVLSVSRAFYLCFVVFTGLYAVVTLFNKKKYLFSVILLISIVTVIMIFLTSNDFAWILNNLITRNNEDSGLGIRGEIWISCIKFLFQHPLRLLFGMSSNFYADYGAATGQLFSFTAHNLFLDILMSFGLIGFIMLLRMFKLLKNRLIIRYGKLSEKYSILPFITFLTYGLTALRTATGKTWIFFLLTYIFAYALKDGQNNDFDT